MVNLQDNCCLDIRLDTKNGTVFYGDGLFPSYKNKILLSNLLPTLLNNSLLYPEIVYEEHKELFYENDRNLTTNGISFDLVLLPQGLLGIEYIKTHIYYTPDEGKETYSTVVEVYYGMLTIIMQKNKPKDKFTFDTSVEEGMIVRLRTGEKLAIPTGFYYTFVNSSNAPVLFVRVYKPKSSFNCPFLTREKGLAYYCIRKNAKQEIVHNPLYKDIPLILALTPNANIKKFGLNEHMGVYSQLRSNMSLFIDSL